MMMQVVWREMRDSTTPPLTIVDRQNNLQYRNIETVCLIPNLNQGVRKQKALSFVSRHWEMAGGKVVLLRKTNYILYDD